MGESNRCAANSDSKIQCIEVLISKTSVAGSRHDLQWTLSVYSLENQPVQKNRVVADMEIYHFMVYDWKRTINKILEDHQIRYSVIQYFTPETIYADAAVDLGVTDNEGVFVSALHQLQGIHEPGQGSSEPAADTFTRTEKECHRVILHEETAQ
jgi:hypothetical protein